MTSDSRIERAAAEAKRRRPGPTENPFRKKLREIVGLPEDAPHGALKTALWALLNASDEDEAPSPKVTMNPAPHVVPPGAEDASPGPEHVAPDSFSPLTMNRGAERGASTRVGSSRSSGEGEESFAASPPAFLEEPPGSPDASEETASRMHQDRAGDLRTYADTPLPEPERDLFDDPAEQRRRNEPLFGKRFRR